MRTSLAGYLGNAITAGPRIIGTSMNPIPFLISIWRYVATGLDSGGNRHLKMEVVSIRIYYARNIIEVGTWEVYSTFREQFVDDQFKDRLHVKIHYENS